jgi:hypothetical protein
MASHFRLHETGVISDQGVDYRFTSRGKNCNGARATIHRKFRQSRARRFYRVEVAVTKEQLLAKRLPLTESAVALTAKPSGLQRCVTRIERV